MEYLIITGVALKKLIIGVMGVVGLITTGLLVLPIFVNFNQYKTEICDAAKSAIGREVSISGDIKLSLLPSPTIQIMNVRVANIKGASHPHMVLVDRLEASLSVLPLLKRHLEFRKVSLVKPRFFLEELPSGEKNWIFEGEGDAGQSLSTQLLGDARANSMLMPAKVDIQKIKILNASLSFQKDKTQFEIADMDLDVKRQSSGAFEGEGQVDHQGNIVKVSGSVDLNDPTLKYVVDARLDGSVLTLRGSYDQKTQEVATSMNLSLRPYDFSYLKEHLQTLPLSLDKHLFIKADVSGTQEVFKFKNIQYDSDALSFKGKASLDLKSQEIMVALSDLPGDGAIEGTVNIKGPLSGQVVASAVDPSKFLKSLMTESAYGQITAKVKEDALKKLKQSTIKASFDYADNVVSVKNLFITVKNSIIRGSCSVHMNGNAQVVNLNLAGQSLSDIGMIFDNDFLKSVNDGRLKGSIDLFEKSPHMDVEATLFGGKVALKGQLKPLKVEASLVHPNLSQLLQVINKNPSTQKLGETKISAEISHTDPILLISNLSGIIKTSAEPVNIAGDLKIHMLNTSTGLEGSLKLGKVDLAFLSADGKSNRGDQSSKGETTGGTKKRSKKESGKGKLDTETEEKKTAGGKWSKEPLLGDGSAFSADLDVRIERLISGDWMVEDALMKVQLKNGTLEIPTFSGRVFGGMMKGSASLSKEKALLNASVQDAQLDRVPVKNAAFKVLKGSADASVDVVSSGKSVHDLVSKLKGLVTISVKKGLFQGFNLQSFVELVKNLNGPQLLPNLMGVMQGGETRFDALKVILSFKDGVGQISSFDLSISDVLVKASGTLNLPAYRADTNWALSIPAKADLPTVKMTVFGPLDNLQKTIDMQAMQQYLMQNIVSKLTKGGNPIENLLGLGGGSDTSSSKNDPSPSQSDANSAKKPADTIEKIIEKPEDAVKDILKGLF